MSSTAMCPYDKVTFKAKCLYDKMSLKAKCLYDKMSLTAKCPLLLIWQSVNHYQLSLCQSVPHGKVSHTSHKAKCSRQSVPWQSNPRQNVWQPTILVFWKPFLPGASLCSTPLKVIFFIWSMVILLKLNKILFCRKIESKSPTFTARFVKILTFEDFSSYLLFWSSVQQDAVNIFCSESS